MIGLNGANALIYLRFENFYNILYLFRSGAGAASRGKVLERVQSHLPARVMLPPARLVALLGQALALQTQRCLYHTTAAPPSVPIYTSLLQDHCCSRDQFPTHPVQVCIFFPQFSIFNRLIMSNNVSIFLDFDRSL